MPWMNTCMSFTYLYILIYCILTRMHEDMLFYEGGVCDTLGNSGFSQVSGELVSFRNKINVTYMAYSMFHEVCM